MLVNRRTRIGKERGIITLFVSIVGNVEGLQTSSILGILWKSYFWQIARISRNRSRSHDSNDTSRGCMSWKSSSSEAILPGTTPRDSARRRKLSELDFKSKIVKLNTNTNIPD